METKIGEVIKKYESVKEDPEAKITELKNDQTKMQKEFKAKKVKIEQDYKVLLAKTKQDFKAAIAKAEQEFNEDRTKHEDAILAQEATIKAAKTDTVKEITQLKDHEDYRNKFRIKDLTKQLEDMNEATDKLRVAVKELKIDLCDCQST